MKFPQESNAMKQLELGDIKVCYRVRGSGSPVIFLHGLAEDHRSWSRQQDALGNCTSYACDLRGHGKTTMGQGDGTLAQLGNDLLGFIENLTGPASVVGFSLGGTIALWAAAQSPELINRVLVFGTSSVVGRQAVSFYADRIAKAADTGSEAFRQAMRADTAAGLFHDHAHLDEIVQSRLDAVGDGAGYANAARAMMKLNAEPLTPALKNIRVPVVIVGAEHDSFCPPKAAAIMLETLGHAEQQNIPAAGHLMNIDNPDAVTAVLRNSIA